MTEGCRCGEICARCGGCRVQHKTREKLEYLGCSGYVEKGTPLARLLDLDGGAGGKTND